jgi:hypothetical protein
MSNIHCRARGKQLTLLILGVLVFTAAIAGGVRFDVVAFGSFRRLSHTGDSSGQAKLADLPNSAGSWGVGALAGLKGEVVLRDGRLLVSRGSDPHGRVDAPQAGDEVALFAAARVREWTDVRLPGDLSQPEFEAFVLERARSLGLDHGEPFPFLVQGRYPRLAWHVLDGQLATAAKHGQHGGASGKRLFEQHGTSGQLVGMYSGARLEGVISHPGERFHIHYIDDAASVSGHVDAYAVSHGAILKLPVR